MGNSTLIQLLTENKKEVLDEWFYQFLGAYPPETKKYFERVENAFTNPVGSNVHRSMVAILDELLTEQDGDKIYRDLEMIMHIKAVQDVKPSNATAFIFGLKSIIQKLFQKEINNGTIKLKELLDFYDTLDTIALLAFNIYMESRELISDMRVREVKERLDIIQRAYNLNEKVDTSTFMRCSNYIAVQEEGEKKE